MITDKIKENQNLIIISHFPGYTRMFVPLLLGGTQFPFKSWVWRDGLGAVLFVTVYSVVGFGIGSVTKSLNMAVTISKVLPMVFIGLFVIWVLIAFIKFRRSKD